MDSPVKPSRPGPSGPTDTLLGPASGVGAPVPPLSLWSHLGASLGIVPAGGLRQINDPRQSDPCFPQQMADEPPLGDSRVQHQW